jgi:hypothetical protein
MSSMSKSGLLVAVVIIALAGARGEETGARNPGPTSRSEAVDIDSRLELFVDDWLIQRRAGVQLKLHSPVRREVVFRFDAPWEGAVSGYVGVFRDESRYRMYYRGWGEDPKARDVTCCAESTDGVRWSRPELGLFEFRGSRRNNIILIGEGTHCFAAFKDLNPAAPAEERYKAISRASVDGKPAIIGFVSPDGINWHRLQSGPLITLGAFDSQNTAFWDPLRRHYAAFIRDFRDGVRTIRGCTSTDFRNWTEPVFLDFGDAPSEHLYTNAVVPYFRAPHVYVGMPMRFHPNRRFLPDHPHAGSSDGVFMSSRDGQHWNRHLEAFIRPGPDRRNWTDRSNMPAWGILPTGDKEMSVYWTEHYRTADTRLRRGTLRTDGFVSVHAPCEGGEFVTRPVTFSGSRLVLNYATSAAGSVQVEIQDVDGLPIEGYRLADAPALYGDELERIYAWKGGPDVGPLAGRPVRLRFVMTDADLYAIRFRVPQRKE